MSAIIERLDNAVDYFVRPPEPPPLAVVPGVPVSLEFLPDSGNRTASNHNNNINLFNEWNNSEPISVDRVKEYIHSLKDKRKENGKRLGANTIRGRKSSLKMAFKRTFRKEANNIAWLAMLDTAFKEIKTPKPKQGVQDKDIMSAYEVKQIVQQAPRKIGLMIRFLYSTGCRANEFLQIKVADCILVSDWIVITVFGKGQKFRDVKILPELYQEIIEAFQSGPGDYLFKNSSTRQYKDKNGVFHVKTESNYSHQYIWGVINDWSFRVLKRRFRTHGHRHSFATNLVENGVPIDAVARLLGHEDSSTTVKFYLHSKVKDTDLRAVQV